MTRASIQVLISKRKKLKNGSGDKPSHYRQPIVKNDANVQITRAHLLTQVI